MANEQVNDSIAAKAEQGPQPRPESELLKLMNELAAKLQPLTLTERRRVVSSVATMLGINQTGSSQPRPATQQQRPQQQQPRNGGR